MSDARRPGSTPGRRIALLIESDGPGGAESVVIRLATGLAERGHEVRPVVLAPGQGWLSGRLSHAGFQVHRPLFTRAIDPGFARDLATWSRRQRIDVLHAHEFTMGFYCGIAGLLARTPHVITMHGGVTFAAAARRRWALRWSMGRAAAVVGVSESTCAHLSHTLRLPRERISLVPNGVPETPGDRSAARNGLGLAADERLLLAVGNLYPVKGHATLVEACGLLAARQDLPPWRVAIAGRGDEEASLRERIVALGLGERVMLLGLRNDIPDLLAAADGWVMPSLSEGLPMALLEAMLARLPIVSSRVGGIPDVIAEGESGLLVPPSDPNALADALTQLLRDPVQARAMGERAYHTAHAEYAQGTMVERYVALYEQALSR